MPLRVVFFGNSESLFSNRHFAALERAPCRIAAVVDVPPAKRTSTNTRALPAAASFVVSALERGIPRFEPTNPNSPEFIAAMRELAPDLFIAAGYMNLLKAEILSVPRIAAANWHASLLPAYRGKHPVFWALRNGERRIGLTVHVMDQGIDTGDILYQVRIRARKRDTVGSAYDRIMDKSVPLVRRLIEDAEKGELRRMPQPQTGASYYSSTREEDFMLDWSRDAEELRRRIQTSPGQCFCPVAGRRIYFLDAQTAARSAGAYAGTLLKVRRTGCVIAAGENALRVRLVRVDGIEREAPELFREMELREGRVLAA